MSRPRRGPLRVLLAVALTTAGLAAVAPLEAASTDAIATFAGGPGRGSAVHLAMRPIAVEVVGTTLYVLEDVGVRTVDLVTGTSDVVVGHDYQYMNSGAAPLGTLWAPCSMAVSANGTIYVGDKTADKVFRYPPGGTASVAASIKDPCEVEIGSDVLYVADEHRVYRVDASGTAVLIAGGGSDSDTLPLDHPRRLTLWIFGLAIDTDDNLFIASGNGIWRVDPTRTSFARYAGDLSKNSQSPIGDGGPALEAYLWANDLATTDDGTLYAVEDTRVRRIGSDGIITSLIGDNQFGSTGDGGPGALARIAGGEGVAVADDGSVLVAEFLAERVRRVTPSIVTTVAGILAYPTTSFPVFHASDYGDGGPAVDAQVGRAPGLGATANGDVYISDPSHRRIRRVDASGRISTIGGGNCCAAGGSNTSPPDVREPKQMSVAPDGDVYFVDGNSLIKKLSPEGVVSVVAGNGLSGGFPPGQIATETALPKVMDVLVRASGIVHFTAGRWVLRIGADGRIEVVAGDGTSGPSGDGGPAVEAHLSAPASLAEDSQGNLWVADGYDVRRIDADGIITTHATVPDGIGGMAIDGDDRLWLLAGWYKVARFSPGSSVEIVAGSGVTGYSVDGTPAIDAKFTPLLDIAIDSVGRVLVTHEYAPIRHIAQASPPPLPDPPTTTSTSSTTSTTTTMSTSTTTTAPTTTTTTTTTSTTTTSTTTTTTTTTTPTSTTTSTSPPVVDLDAPVVHLGRPAARVIGSTWIPVAWSGTDSSGVAHFDVQMRTIPLSGSRIGWTDWQVGTDSTKATFRGRSGSTYCFRVRAADAVGNMSAYTTPKCTTVPLTSGQLSYSGTWKRYESAAVYGALAHWSTKPGATAIRTKVPAERIYLLATKCPSCGVVRVSWNGTPIRTIDLRASTQQRSQLIGIAAWPTARYGTLQITVISSGKLVMLEGLAIYRD